MTVSSLPIAQEFIQTKPARQGPSNPSAPPSVADSSDNPDDIATVSERERQSTTVQLSVADQRRIRELSNRDREVRAHELAHSSVGGRYAGAPQYTFERGPDGRNYAVAGEVSIDASPVPGDPQATLQKAQIIRRAALAPLRPSSQDLAVAAQATSLQQQAQLELAAERSANSSSAGGSQGAAAPDAANSTSANIPATIASDSSAVTRFIQVGSLADDRTAQSIDILI